MSVILLIDDEPGMTNLVEMTLDDDVRVVSATNLAEALQAARNELPDLVLLDLALGKEEGLVILPRLREEPVLSQVPIVAFTVHDSKREEALELGVDGFVAKPFKTEDLREAVEPLLRRRFK